MKKAPNWNDPKDEVDPFWKRDLLRYLGRLLGLRVFIETGTCEGFTAAALHEDFDEIHTIELSPHYHDIASVRLSAFPNVHVYQGNSETVLRDLLLRLDSRPTLFWLDAHSSGGLTADAGDPVAAELAAICELRPDALVVIDDQKDSFLWLVPPETVEGWVRDLRCGELLLHKGQYDIPPFE